MPHFDRHVFVCVNERGAESRLLNAATGARRFRRLRGLGKAIRANNAGCLDQCEHGVTVVVYPEQVWYGGVTVDDVKEIVDRHLIGGEPVARLVLTDPPASEPTG
jgi:(2Fe-2S) ferredoxin